MSWAAICTLKVGTQQESDLSVMSFASTTRPPSTRAAVLTKTEGTKEGGLLVGVTVLQRTAWIPAGRVQCLKELLQSRHGAIPTEELDNWTFST